MTHALLTAPLTPDAMLELEHDFGWQITVLERGAEFAALAGEYPDVSCSSSRPSASTPP